MTAKKSTKTEQADTVEQAPDATGAPGTDADTAPELLQFPSVAGHADVEIAQRSADVDEPAATEHRKVFVIQRKTAGADPDSDDELHARNIDAMRQAAINQGLRMTSDGRYVGCEPHPDGESLCLTYAVAVVPAAVATQEQNVVAVTVEQQHDLDTQTQGGTAQTKE